MITATTSANLGCLAAVLLAGLSAPAQAQPDSGWTLGIGVGRSAATIDDGRIRTGLGNQGLSVGSLEDRDRDTTYKLSGGYRFNRYLGLEASWFDLGAFGFTATTTPAGTLAGDVTLRGFGLDVVGQLPLTERLSLLARVGAASVRTRGAFSRTGAVTLPYPATSTHDRDTGAKYGVGLAWRLSDAWQVRTEAERYRVSDSVNNKGHVDVMSVGLVYHFGVPPAQPRSAAMPAPQAAYVAPLPPAQAVAPGAPAVPPPLVAAAPPPAPMRVTMRFSAEALFDFDQSTLRPQGQRDLDAFVAQLRGMQYDSVQVIGHTDRLGSTAYNQALSQRRADIVQAYLVRAGVPAGLLTSRGLGESMPITQPDDCKATLRMPALVACLQPDRRVEVDVNGSR